MSELEDMMNKVLSSPEDMSRIMQLAQSLTSASSAEHDEPPAQPAQGTAAPDPEMAAVLGKLMRSLQADCGGNDKTVLLTALKPYLREERRNKIDKALRIAKIARIASSAFGEMGGGSFGL